jgi:hypothetical protein
MGEWGLRLVLRRTQHANGQQEDRSQEFKNPVHCYPENAEWQEKEPHKLVSDKGQESQRPAKEKQDQPKEEFYHDCTYGRRGTRLH